MKRSLMHVIPLIALATTACAAHAQSNPSLPGAARSAGNAQPASGNVTRSALPPWRQIEGLWDEQVVQVDCDSGATLHPIGRGTNLFVPGGSLVATNNAPPTVMGVSLGQWWYGRDRKFHAKMRLNRFQPPSEAFLGIREIQRDIAVSDHGNSLDGVVFTQDYYPDGSLAGAPICAVETGIRVAIP